MSNPLIGRPQPPHRPRIMVVGDLILDRCVWCDAPLISAAGSPAALLATGQKDRLGGAANVAAMLRALDAEVMLAGVVGNDGEGRTITELLHRADVNCGGLVIDPARPTALQQRFLACSQSRFPQQVFQVDREESRPLDPAPVAELLTRLEQMLPQVDRLLISDHGKGIGEGDIIPWIVDLANSRGISVVTDPTGGATYGTTFPSRADGSGKPRHPGPAARHPSPATREKIVDLAELLTQLREHRQCGHCIVMTNGCFDILHPGHVASLEAARQQGDCLVVGLNSDRSVQALKGPQRPVINQQGRAEMLAALACVDYVVIFDDASVASLVEQVLPDVLVKSAEYSLKQVVGHDIVQRHGGRVVSVPMKSEYSTTRLIETVASEPDLPSPATERFTTLSK